MEVSYCSPLQLQDNSFLLDCESLLSKPLGLDPASDSGYFSAGSSLSPTSSVDSFCFSPSSLQPVANQQVAFDCFVSGSPAAPLSVQQTQTQLPFTTSSSSASNTTTKKSRSRYPGKKRQTASEREKLRMRDLTKALNHLRMYLPPSVAPLGQSLTKIETLRLTIRYISFLSAQLGLSQEELQLRSSSRFVEQSQTIRQNLGQPASSYSPNEEHSRNTTLQSCLLNSHQVSSGLYLNSEQCWTLQQHIQHLQYGQC